MASKNQVTLTFAGDSAQLEKTFDTVGGSSERMADKVGGSSERVARETGSAYDAAGEAADGAEGRAQGFSDTLTGTADLASGTSMIMKGNLFEGFVTAGQGAADLAGGMASFVIPALKALSVESLKSAVNTGRQTVAMGAQKVGMLAGAVATNTMALAQRGLNLAMRMNPIGLVITALILLGTGLVIAYKKSATFRAIVQGAFAGVKTAMGWVVTAGEKVWEFFKFIGPKIGGALKGVAAVITAPFRAAFGAVRAAWNNTIGGKGFDIPSWVPEIGGKSFRIPYFHTGTIVGGGMGSESLAVLKAGERVTSGRNSDGGGVVTFRADGQFARQLLDMLKYQVRIDGGLDVVFER